MPDRYISDDQVIINVQGLRTVQRADWEIRGTQPHRLMWSYKGQEHSQSYADQAARDAMYNALRQALTAEKERKQPGGYRKIDAIKMVRETGKACGLDIGLAASAIVEALEPIMRPGGQGDAV